jgi:CarD family transcriptional regulator
MWSSSCVIEEDTEIMFEVGDTVVHAHRGAAQIVDVDKLKCLGSDKEYYAIRLLNGTDTRVWVAVQDAENGELRQPLTKRRLAQVWRVLKTKPHELPLDHKERYKEIETKLNSGDPVQVAEALRDLVWKKEVVRPLTAEGRRLRQRCVDNLSSEVAVAQGDSLESVQEEISAVLDKNIAARITA